MPGLDPKYHNSKEIPPVMLDILPAIERDLCSEHPWLILHKVCCHPLWHAPHTVSLATDQQREFVLMERFRVYWLGLFADEEVSFGYSHAELFQVQGCKLRFRCILYLSLCFVQIGEADQLRLLGEYTRNCTNRVLRAMMDEADGSAKAKPKGSVANAAAQTGDAGLQPQSAEGLGNAQLVPLDVIATSDSSNGAS